MRNNGNGRRRLSLFLACIIVFITVYELILPAIAVDLKGALQLPGLSLVREAPLTGQDEEDPADAWPAQSFLATTRYVRVSVQADEGAFPAGTSMEVRTVTDTGVLEEITQTAQEAGATQADSVRAVDIIFRDPSGEKIEPRLPIRVSMSCLGNVEMTDTAVVHVDDQGKAEVVEQADPSVVQGTPAENELVFDTDQFSIYAIVGTKIERTILTSDGRTYKVTVAYTEDAQLPEGTELGVSEIREGTSRYEGYAGKAAQSLGTDLGAVSYIKVLDIFLMKDGIRQQPQAPVKVSVELLDREEALEQPSVLHFADTRDEGEQVQARSEGKTVSFNADSFSAYAIVQGPSSSPMNWQQITGLGQLGSEGLYIGTTSGFYLTDVTAIGSQDKSTTGIVKTTPSKNYPPEQAARYYFETVPGKKDSYYIYCLDEDGSPQYVRNTGDASLYLTQDSEKRTAFQVQVDASGRFRMNNGNRYWNMWNGANGNHIAAWTTAGDANNYFYIWKKKETTGDPYGLDGSSYGLMSWTEGTTGKALMAESTEHTLAALSLTVMSRSGNNADKLFVPDESGISSWQFEWAGDDLYYISSVIDGIRQYLKIQSGRLSLTADKEESCRIQVVPGTGTHEGEICLCSGNTTLTYSGNIDTGFQAGGRAGSEWLHLTELSELTSDYFMTYTASKVSVSDPSVTNGSHVIVYTRVWNEAAKKYEFYAVDHDGSLVRCFESGDEIQWVGSRLNSMLWNFVEYYWQDTQEPNYYYELYNQFSQQFIAPPASSGQPLSDTVIGINLNGRRDGRYYSPVLAWDDANYAYIGLKADRTAGRIVSCSKAEADDFYFAIVQDIPADDVLHTIKTVDHAANGITMKMTNFSKREDMSRFLGSDNAYKNGNTESGLLSTNLAKDGYPTTKAGNSLSSWFSAAPQVNHLFIESTYRATGYYEYDSVQNFAHLDQSKNEFVVYREIGTTDSNSGKFYTHGQFFPYNDLSAGRFSVQKNLTSALGENLPDTDPRKYEQLYHVQNPSSPDYYMGAELSASFTQTPDGLDDWGHDIIYEFTGDDDFWLYVDGELIIDLGGIHDALPGSVNYRTGEVTVNGKKTTLRDLFYDNCLKRGQKASQARAYVNEIFKLNDNGQYVFKDYTTHTMKIFYLERGAGASNLHMRFNLASIRTDTVELSKSLTGVDKSESVLAEFPYQIWYEGEDRAEHLLTNFLPDDPLYTDNYVLYKDTSNPVSFYKTLTIDGTSYENVFMLRPDETAQIRFPEGAKNYRITECGVNTDVYSRVLANGEELTGSAGDGYAPSRKDFGLPAAAISERSRAAFVNEVDPDALRDLTVTKLLYKEDGVTPLSAQDDATEFNFRLYLGAEFDGDPQPAAMHTYHIKDPSGRYCRWDSQKQVFTAIGRDKTDYSDLTDQEKIDASFTTSMNGSISRLPVGYTVEIRHVLAGTRFQVVERPAEIPDGYSFQKYVSNAVPVRGTLTEALEGASGTVSSDADPHVDICNLKGWGLRVNKSWADQDYMTDRKDTCFAVFTGQSEQDLTLVEGTVRRLAFGEKTLYWYFPHLPVPVPFSQYEIREVTITNQDPSVDEEGVVTDPGTVTPIPGGGTVSLTGRQKGESADAEFTYTVSYQKGTIESDTNVRTDTVSNSRPGLVILKQDAAGNALEGASFTLENGQSNLIGTFSSDSEGLVTEAFFSKGSTYTLTETKTPQGWQGLSAPVSISLEGDDVQISGPGEEEYVLLDEEGRQTLILKNRPVSFAAVKRDSSSLEAMPGVVFALHKQHTVNGVTQFSPSPIVGYEKLISDEEGTIPGITQALPAGVYQLREIQTGRDYEKLASYIHFTITETGFVRLEDHPQGVSLLEETDPDGNLHYSLQILNAQIRQLSFQKVDISDVNRSALEGAVFDLYAMGTENGENERQIPACLTGLTSGADGMFRDASGNTVFELPVGRYELEETKAPENYHLKGKPVTITVTAEDVIYDEGTDVSRIGTGKSRDPQTGVYLLKITNSNGYELPSTGGPGRGLYTLAGLLLIGLALAGRMFRPAADR